MKPLVVIPSYIREESDKVVTVEAVESIRKTQGDAVDVLVVDDGSPDLTNRNVMGEQCAGLNAEVRYMPDNQGFSKTVNVGLSKALEEGRDAILVNADVEMQSMNWLGHCMATTAPNGEKAGIVGALLLYPDGTIQHAGIFFSLLTRSFDHRFKHGPGNLPEALEKQVCPVTAAFQYIRHSTLVEVGVYDEEFSMSMEDVDYCIRAFIKGVQCVYNPNVRAFHHEYKFRGRPSDKVERWQRESLAHFMVKYAKQSFAEFVPNW